MNDVRKEVDPLPIRVDEVGSGAVRPSVRANGEEQKAVLARLHLALRELDQLGEVRAAAEL